VEVNVEPRPDRQGRVHNQKAKVKMSNYSMLVKIVLLNTKLLEQDSVTSDE